MRDFENVRRLLVKVGSSSVVKSDLSVNEEALFGILSKFKELGEKGIGCALVSSGAVATGMHELKLSKRPKDMSLKQACAAVGQAKLMESYNEAASKLGLVLGQILVSHDDFQVRKRMLFLSGTLDSMFKNGIIPVINENDALAVEEIKVGDNDTLASLIAPMVNADLLVLFSDIDGLYDKNPKLHADARLIREVDRIDEKVLQMVGGSVTDVGTGGMETKIDAAISCMRSGCDMLVCNSNRICDLDAIVAGEEIGTLFRKEEKGISNREHWIIFKSSPHGSVVADKGLEEALKDRKVSILPKGVVSAVGEFLCGEVVNVISSEGTVIAKGITNYSSAEINMIAGQGSDEICKILGYAGKKQIIHANDLVVLKEGYYGHFVKKA